MNIPIRQIMQQEIADHIKAGYEWSEKDVFAVNAAVMDEFVKSYDQLLSVLKDYHQAASIGRSVSFSGWDAAESAIAHADGRAE